MPATVNVRVTTLNNIVRSGRPVFPHWAVRRLACVAVGACLFAGILATAQPSDADRGARKVVHRVNPEYPVTLKQAGIGGKVRLRAVVQPSGTVSKVEIIGGNPVLADSAARAVMQWKYAPAAWTTQATVEIDFHP